MILLTNKQNEKIRQIAKKYHLIFLVVFGSEAEGKLHKKSDLDLAYSASHELDYRREYELIQALRKILGGKIGKMEIELVNLRKISPLLMKNIAFKGKLLTELAPHSFARFQMYAFKLFVEAKPLLRLRDQYIAKNL